MVLVKRRRDINDQTQSTRINLSGGSSEAIAIVVVLVA
jgi:hypothetical protein